MLQTLKLFDKKKLEYLILPHPHARLMWFLKPEINWLHLLSFKTKLCTLNTSYIISYIKYFYSFKVIKKSYK